jgi:PAS domain S-box-containing protein
LGLKTKIDDKVFSDGEYLRLLINNTDDPIWMVDNRYTIIECNESFKKWIYCFIGQELHKGDNILFNQQDKKYLEKFEMCYQLALNGRSFRSVEDMTVNGEIRYPTVSFNPVYYDDKIIGVSCFARDITEQRKHLLRIEQQNAALKEIAFIQSHNVRGPVATIMGLEQLFNYDEMADPINKEIMEGIALVSKQLDLIIKEIIKKSNEIDLQPGLLR